MFANGFPWPGVPVGLVYGKQSTCTGTHPTSKHWQSLTPWGPRTSHLLRREGLRRGLPEAAGADRRRDVAAGVKAAVCVVVAAHAPANGRDATPVLRAGVPRVGEDEDAPRDGALLGCAEAGDVSAAARLPPGAVLALGHHGVTKLLVGTAAAAAEPGGRRRGAGSGCAGVGAGGPRRLGLLSI